MTRKYTEMRKQVYELAKSIGVDTKTRSGRRIGRGINNITENFLPIILGT